jgi:hypothetical protein
MAPSSFPAITSAAKFSEDKLKRIRAALATLKLGESVCVVATGSFGRREASADSDIDFFVLHAPAISPKSAGQKHKAIEDALRRLGMKLPAKDGAFNSIHPTMKLIENVGGSKDSNRNMTLRLLLLLEGTYLHNSKLFEDSRRKILERYVIEGTNDHGLARFLLNDFIRYYRTMCVDFEYKTGEQGKGWGVRNLKLLYSRKLLYFGGVVAIAETAQRSRPKKLDVLVEMLSRPPLERIRSLCGSDSQECLELYDNFLKHLGDTVFRRQIEGVLRDRGSHIPEFTNLKNDSIRFSWALRKLLDRRYSPVHPIHTALIL